MDNIINGSDLNSFIVVRKNETNEVNAKIKVNISNKMHGKVDIKQLEQSNDSSDFISTLYVKPKNKMYGKTEIVEKIKIDTVLNPIEDSFVRSSYPTFNYGSQQDLIVGINQTTKEKFYSYIKFGLYDKVPKDVVFTKAIIRINLINNIKTDNILQIYEASNRWSEYGVTYANKPPLGKLLKEISLKNITENFIEYDILSIMPDIMKGNTGRYGLVLVLKNDSNENFVRFYSRQSDFPPTIDLEYFDNNPISYGQTFLNNTFTVVKKENNNINSNLIVPTHDKEDDLYNFITVKNNNYLDSTITVSNGNINGKIKINNVNDISSGFIVTKDNLKCNLFVPASNSIDSIIKVKNEDIDDINSTIEANKPNLDNTFFLYSNSNINCSLSVRRYDNNDINNKVVISNPEMHSKLFIKYVSDKNSTITVRKELEGDLNNCITVRNHVYKDVNNTVLTTQYNEIENNITVLPTSDVKNRLFVRVHKENDINSNLSLYNTQDTNCSILVRETNTSSILSKIVIRRYDVNNVSGKLHITGHDEVDNCIYISNPETSNKITVRRYDKSDFNCKLFVLPVSDLNNTILAMETNDMNCSMLVEIPFANDCESVIRVRDDGVINNTIKVRNTLEDDKNSVLYIKQDWLNSTLKVNNPFVNCSMAVNQPCLHSELEVFKSAIENSLYVFRSTIDSNVIVNNPSISNTITVNKKDLACNIDVNKTSLDNTIVVRKVINDDLNNTIKIINQDINDLNYSVKVKSFNKMYGKVEIEPPTKNTMILQVVKDAYIRSDFPYLNYGKTNDMYVGKSSNKEIYRSLLQFDLNKIPSTAYIIKANIIITKSNLTNKLFNLYSLSDKWQEENITFANQPNANELLNGNIDSNTYELKFDITNLLNDKVIKEKLLNGFLIKDSNEDASTNLQRLYTKESDLAPRLELEYFDLAVQSNYSNNLNSTIFVKEIGSSSIDNSLVVPSYDKNKDVDCNLTVKNNTYLENKLRVIKEFVDCKISIANNKDNDLTNTFKIRLDGQDEFLNHITVNNLAIDGKVTVRKNEDNNINSSIVVRKDIFNNIDTVLTVRNDVNNDKIGTIYINNKELNNSIIVTTVNDINSVITVRKNTNVDLNFGLEVVYGSNILSNINVNGYCDIFGSVVAREYKNNDRKCSISVINYNEIENKIIVADKKDMNCSIQVRNNGYNEILNSVKVYIKSDINGIIQITPSSTINNNIIITNASDINNDIIVPEYNNINNIIYVRNNKDLDFENNLIVRKHTFENLNNTLQILPTSDVKVSINVFNISNIQSSMVIRQYLGVDINCSFEVVYNDDINNTMLVEERKVIGYAFIM